MEASFLFHAQTTLFTLLLFTTTYINSCSTTKPNTAFIKKSCNTTLYPHLCYKSLSIYANKIQKSPKRLATTALSITLSASKSTTAAMKKLSKDQGLKPREVIAMADCVEVLGDSVYELQRSMKEMARVEGGGGSSDFEFQMSNIETWVSAALTDDDTCTEGFAGKAMNGVVKTMVRSYIVKVAHLTSNALAIVNNYAATHNNPHATSP
ncbi:hypothetical protein CsSME_00044776 [Camellia sinensis var. sinensis]|uniref:Pectinesterase inhibitor domain-containing protein n=1 Tax=Camellia sinensis TaxID=4442 RepID=A0A7J7HNE2_CAMSI|nr:hypothetical protein HYC85_007239 [Camellia sinensis]